MRPIALLTALAVVAFLGNIARGEDYQAPSHLHLEALDWLVGQWVHESLYPEANAGEIKRHMVHRIRLCSTWACDKQVLVTVGVESVDHRTVLHSLTLVWWQAEKEQIVQFGMDTMGRYGDATIRLTDDTSVGKHRMFLPDGRLFQTTHTIERIDHESYTLQLTDSTTDGMNMPEGPIMLFERVQE